MADKSEKTVVEEVSKVVESAKELQDSAASLISRTTLEEDALRQRSLSLDSTIRRLRSSIASLLHHGQLDSKEADKLEEELYRASYVLSEGDASAFIPIPSKSHGAFHFYWRFLSMFLGPINVRATRKDVKLKVKEEYNSFRVCFYLYCNAKWFLNCGYLFYLLKVSASDSLLQYKAIPSWGPALSVEGTLESEPTFLLSYVQQSGWSQIA
ncbi:hypothetical protein TEA_017783 [Camellia sinensis var. sinensis]|uniref:Uncharacterized protein n=1 Tax=Camellia sinensis var. sinensis TaxID=542762 RepID=A0A4S4D8D1_CAMSN|nr:hypothetical protein TEA_017783 [Camellia sinensis var. sinensis]